MLVLDYIYKNRLFLEYIKRRGFIMRIILAARSINEFVIGKIERGEKVDPSELTPESAPAGFARVSRDPRSVTELREEAAKDVSAARKSNKAIFYGMGHHSIAEHGILSFDVMEVSRLAIEALELHRIGVAYTEKSQRYITLNGDYLIPEDLPQGLNEEFNDNIKRQNGLYHRSIPELLEFHKKENQGLSKIADEKKAKGIQDKFNSEKNILEGKAKEDARYIVSMATLGQLGFSCNIRELEYIITHLRHHPLMEVQEMSKTFYKIGSEVAPSLIIYSDAEAFEKEFGKSLENRFQKEFDFDLKKACAELGHISLQNFRGDDVELLSYSRDGDKKIMAALLSRGLGINNKDAHSYISTLSLDEARKFLLDSFKELTEFDRMPREFELATYTFKIITTATEFAQLKRHRMMTLLPEPYDPNLGFTLPESVIESGLKQEFKDEIDKASGLFYKIKEYNSSVAEYALTNAHRRENIVKMNLRELYAVSRLREDGHAQWEIRNHAHKMSELAREVTPLTAMFLGGKDQFKEIKRKLYHG